MKNLSRLPNYLRMHRKRAGLSQRELAYLLGCRFPGKVSRYERFARRPSLETALAFELIVGVPVGELFAGIREEVAHEVRKGARRLRRRLTRRQIDRRKIAVVTAILKASNNDPKLGSIR